MRNGTTPFHQAQYSGNYYNWYTATAGTGTYAMVSENAPSSVCPKGWKLPTGGEGGQFAALTDAMVGIFTNTYDIRDKSYDMQFSPNYFILSGYYYNSTSDFRTYAGTSGYWWSRTAGSTNNVAYGLSTYETFILPAGENGKHGGSAVRCVADRPSTPFTQLENMQSIDSHSCTVSVVGDEKILRDARDGRTYVIRKLQDGKCWMIQNLQLGEPGVSVTLTPEDSDVTSNFTIPANAITDDGKDSWWTSHTEDDVNKIRIHNNGGTWVQPTTYGSDSTVNTAGIPPSQAQYIGNYYTWYTATAGTGNYTMASGNAPSSICPKGWKLPSLSDFMRLTTSIVNISYYTNPATSESLKMQSSPNYFILSGEYASRVGSQGNSSYWWASTASGSTQAYAFWLATTVVSPNRNANYKDTGNVMRCMMR